MKLPLWTDSNAAAVATFFRNDEGEPLVEFAQVSNSTGMPITMAEYARLCRSLADEIDKVAESLPNT